MKKMLLMVVLSTSLSACHKPKPNIATILSSNAAGAPITFNETKMMVDTYAKYAKGINGKPVTTSVWFDIKQIHRIDSLLRDEEKKGVKTDGLRLYFATYPELDLNNKPYPDPFRNTVIFVSTKDSLVGKVHYHQNYFNHPEAVPMIPENRGELCEPHCKGKNGL